MNSKKLKIKSIVENEVKIGCTRNYLQDHARIKYYNNEFEYPENLPQFNIFSQKKYIFQLKIL